MRRTVMLGVLLSLVLCSVSLTYAQQFCWRLQDAATPPNNLLDLVRCGVTAIRGTDPVIFALNCSHEADPLYHAIDTGSGTQDVEVDFTKIRIGLNVSHTATGFFGNNRVCELTALLIADVPTNDPTFLDGTWSMQCSGASGATPGTPGVPFNVSGKLNFLPCPADVASLSQAQQEISAQQMNAFGEPRAAGLGNFVTLEK